MVQYIYGTGAGTGVYTRFEDCTARHAAWRKRWFGLTRHPSGSVAGCSYAARTRSGSAVRRWTDQRALHPTSPGPGRSATQATCRVHAHGDFDVSPAVHRAVSAHSIVRKEHHAVTVNHPDAVHAGDERRAHYCAAKCADGADTHSYARSCGNPRPACTAAASPATLATASGSKECNAACPAHRVWPTRCES